MYISFDHNYLKIFSSFCIFTKNYYMSFQVQFTTRWSDFDPNRHMRHTAYNDYAAEVRVRYFASVDCPIGDFAKEGVGPVMFTEHTSFRKEIHLGENIVGTIKLFGLSENAERWKIRHEIFNEQGLLAAVIDVYGAWLDLDKRKLTGIPYKFRHVFDSIEHTEDFEIIPVHKK